MRRFENCRTSRTLRSSVNERVADEQDTLASIGVAPTSRTLAWLSPESVMPCITPCLGICSALVSNSACQTVAVACKERALTKG